MLAGQSLASSQQEAHSQILIKAAPWRLQLCVLWDACIPTHPAPAKLPLTHCAGFSPLILALGPTTHPSSQTRGAVRSVVVQDTHTHARIDPRLSVFADHFTGQSPYPSLQGHCGAALTEKGASFTGKSPLSLPASFTQLLQGGWRKGSPCTDIYRLCSWRSFRDYREASGLQSWK